MQALPKGKKIKLMAAQRERERERERERGERIHFLIFSSRGCFKNKKKTKMFYQVLAESSDNERAFQVLLDAIEAAKYCEKEGVCLVSASGEVLLEMELLGDGCNWQTDDVDGTASFRTDDRRTSSAYLAELFPDVIFRVISWGPGPDSNARETTACYSTQTRRLTASQHRPFAPADPDFPRGWKSSVWAGRVYFPEDTQRWMDAIADAGRAWRPQITAHLEQLFPRNTRWMLQHGRAHYDSTLTFEIRASGLDPPTTDQISHAIEQVVDRPINVSFDTQSGHWHASIRL